MPLQHNRRIDRLFPGEEYGESLRAEPDGLAIDSIAIGAVAKDDSALNFSVGVRLGIADEYPFNRELLFNLRKR